ncbi:MAG TPA: DUF4388 domain-containing protein [Chloroflexi bacterium]|nr:DUF4388 domain-containing protein [Chloroflexota bacterium]
MAVGGRLSEMSLPTLIQTLCNEGTQARLELRRGDQKGAIYFDKGGVVHAEVGRIQGEEAVYELLTWEDGEFELQVGVAPPRQSITVNWSGLLLEGMRRLDERRERENVSESSEGKGEMAQKKRSELIAEAIANLLAESADIEGGALVGIDGLVLSANVPVRGIDETLVGAAAAAIFGLSKRSVAQLKRGEFFQTLIQGSEGNIIVTAIDPRTVFVAITPPDVNLGMVFYEARRVAQRLAEVLK